MGNTVNTYRALLSGKAVSFSKRGYTKGHFERGVIRKQIIECHLMIE
ncbi:MAG TPA: hypothetical protein VJA23_00525 [Candidatus Nanoarchaeia archaeon]|nr:hypothetical protein [Candidatus Nanoarchaeia archaeon]